jgi:hypothetical protein
MNKKINPHEQENLLSKAEKAWKRQLGSICGDCRVAPRLYGDWLCDDCRSDQKDWLASDDAKAIALAISRDSVL